jgi:CubicO group peptidase (beta-lactamase class C family)
VCDINSKEQANGRLLLGALALLFCSLTPAFCADDEVAAQLREYMAAEVKAHRFSGAVLVAQGGRVLLKCGFGPANRELNVCNKPGTSFGIASLTKQFTASAIMLLQERGKLRVSDPVANFIPNWPAAWKDVTIHHLLTHTSGIPDLDLGAERDEILNSDDPLRILDRLREKSPAFAPGEKMAYSNLGYVLLGCIVEKASGQRYADFFHDNIFAPLKMSSTRMENFSEIVADRAAGYSLHEGRLVNAARPGVPASAAGGLRSTVEDLYRWDRALCGDCFLSRSSRDAMFTAYTKNYGYGWVVTTRFGRRMIRHNGTMPGFHASIARYPDEQACVIVLSNTDFCDSDIIGRELTAVLFGEAYDLPKERKALKLKRDELALFAGNYQPPESDAVIAIVLEGKHLYGQRTGNDRQELFAETRTKFYVPDSDETIEFVFGDDGTVTHCLLQKPGHPDVPARKAK